MSEGAGHEVTLVNRKQLRITGVLDVESFDTEEFLLSTQQGYLAVRGEDLHMKNLNLEAGEVAIEGYVLDMTYMDQETRGERAKGFFGKLFR